MKIYLFLLIAATLLYAASASSPPSITAAYINSTNPSTNSTNQNLTAHPSGASDADNDNITYAYRWYNSTGIIAQSVHIEEGLVLYMPFDYDARDYALGNDGTVSGATLNKTDFKVGSGSFTVNGINQNIQITDNIALDNTILSVICMFRSEE